MCSDCLGTELTSEDTGPEPSLLPPGWASPAALAAGPHLTRRHQNFSASELCPKAGHGQTLGKRG